MKLSIFEHYSLFLMLVFRNVIWRLLSSATFTTICSCWST